MCSSARLPARSGIKGRVSGKGKGGQVRGGSSKKPWQQWQGQQKPGTQEQRVCTASGATRPGQHREWSAQQVRPHACCRRQPRLPGWISGFFCARYTTAHLQVSCGRCVSAAGGCCGAGVEAEAAVRSASVSRRETLAANGARRCPRLHARRHSHEPALHYRGDRKDVRQPGGERAGGGAGVSKR